LYLSALAHFPAFSVLLADERDGFMVLKNVLTNEDIAKYEKRFKEICLLPLEEIRKLPFLVMHDVKISKTSFVPDENSITKLQGTKLP
jgi:hypothetical protein